jgi:hypothetical protein
MEVSLCNTKIGLVSNPNDKLFVAIICFSDYVAIAFVVSIPTGNCLFRLDEACKDRSLGPNTSQKLLRFHHCQSFVLWC